MSLSYALRLILQKTKFFDKAVEEKRERGKGERRGKRERRKRKDEKKREEMKREREGK